MKLVTKEPYVHAYDCKFINFNHNEVGHEDEVEIVLKDDTIDYEKITNIDYIDW